MNILYFCQHFSTPKGSSGTRAYEMAKALLKEKHNVTIVCGSYNGGNTGLTTPFIKGQRTGIIDGIATIEFNLTYSNHDNFIKRSTTFLKFALKSIKIALTYKCDIVFATTTPLTSGIPGIFARWLRKKIFVFEVRDLWPELPKAMGVIRNPLVLYMLSILEWLCYHSAHRCIALSPGIAEGIAKQGISPKKIAMIPNGCDLEIFAAQSTQQRPLNIKETDLMAIFTGTHGIANGLDAVLDAAATLKKEKADHIKFVLIGQGKLKENLQKRAKKDGLDNVIFHDPVSKTELAKIMASADIGLQILANIPAFYYGTSPNKFFDYLSAGLPVLNNYPGWLADLINTHNCGFAINPNNPQEFANTLIAAANNKEDLIIKGKNARKLAENQFSRETLSQKWVQWVTKEPR